MKKTTKRRKLVLGREIVKSLTTELTGRHLQDVHGGQPPKSETCPGCSEPQTGCTTTNMFIRHR